MHINEIEIENFRGIRKVHLQNLKSTVVIAGANGSGKSCIFDAIRLLKSAYGGYQQNEWHHWMSEFQINFNQNADALRSFCQNPSLPMSIKCKIKIHPKEREYLERHGEELVRHSIWRLIAPEMYGWSSYRAAPMAAQYRDREPEVSEHTKIQLSAMRQELSQDYIVGHLWLPPGGDLNFAPSKALEILFSSFMPGELGLIDYHGPQRMYTREQVSNINLDLNAATQQGKNHALYNYNSKYGNVKAELASSYIKEIIGEKAGVKPDESNSLNNTLKELFSTFFPDKEFLGLKPTVDGAVEFPVLLSNGSVHDLNELSAGEKEILYGYLRIRNSAPCYSIILIDEPELHLNPRLVQGLPRFYHQHLGIALDNQIWLVTHSDAFLREAIGRPEYSVYHMVGASGDPKAPQILPITLGEAAERALISLVGDIAAYRPGKKVVIFEGGGDSDFDSTMASRLFPILLSETNTISGGNKLRVRELHNVIDSMTRLEAIPFKCFSITDQDAEDSVVDPPRYKWGAYHIENYILEPLYILRAAKALDGDFSYSSIEVYDLLRQSARVGLDKLVQHKLREFANRRIVSAIDLGFAPKRSDIANATQEAASRSSARIATLLDNDLSVESLTLMENSERSSLQQDLSTDNWRKTFRGRDILKEFCRVNCSAPYESFRNLVISRMVDDGFQPEGMKLVIDEIIAA